MSVGVFELIAAVVIAVALGLAVGVALRPILGLDDEEDRPLAT